LCFSFALRAFFSGVLAWKRFGPFFFIFARRFFFVIGQYRNSDVIFIQKKNLNRIKKIPLVTLVLCLLALRSFNGIVQGELHI